MLEIRGIWLRHMSRWDRYVLRPRIWMETSRSGTVSYIGPYIFILIAASSFSPLSAREKRTGAVPLPHAIRVSPHPLPLVTVSCSSPLLQNFKLYHFDRLR